MGAWHEDLLGLTLGRMLTQKAQRNGDKPALIYLPDDRTLSYRELENLSNRVANSLKRTGVQRGVHVAVLTENRWEQIVSYFALAKLGAASVPVNTAAKGYFLERFIGHSDSASIIMEPEFLENLAEVADTLPALETIILFGVSDPAQVALPAKLANRRLMTFDSLFDGPDGLVDEAEPSDLAQILYTSGTTGPSKGNMFRHTGILNWARQMSERQELNADDVYLTVFPLFHGGAWLNATMTTLWVNGTVAIGRRFSASQFLNQARQCGATRAIMVAVASFLAAQPPSPSDRNHKIKNLFSPPQADIAAFEERFGLRLVNGYGLTDYGSSHYGSPNDPRSKQRSVGRPYPEWHVRIVDDQGRELPPNTPGEILLRCDIPGGTASGYYKMPEATLEAWRDLWFHTGDMGYIDEDGYMFFVDRKKDAIRRRGENISSMELEMVLRRHPAVAHAAFFPVGGVNADSEVGVAIIVEAGETITEADVVAYCQKEMPKFATPRFIRFVDAYPMTSSGKVQKQTLRSETESMLDTVWDRERDG